MRALQLLALLGYLVAADHDGSEFTDFDVATELANFEADFANGSISEEEIAEGFTEIEALIASGTIEGHELDAFVDFLDGAKAIISR